MSDDFPADLRQFIIDHLNSVAELEVLLLLRTTPEKEWTAAEVGKSLYAATEVSAAQLANLHKCGFLKLKSPVMSMLPQPMKSRIMWIDLRRSTKPATFL